MAEDHPTPTEPEGTAAAPEPAAPPPVTPKEKARPKARKTRAKAAEAEAEAKAEVVAESKDRVKDKAPAKPKRRTPAAGKSRSTGPVAARSERRSKSSAGAQAPVVRAQAKYVRTSARKARLVCDHIRGKSVVEARAILAFAPRAVAQDWAKLLNSAVANAEHNHELVGEDLRVLAAFADEGPTLKRFRPRAMGRATPIRKRTSHLTITLTPKE
jgi:ribosomal protein L22